LRVRAQTCREQHPKLGSAWIWSGAGSSVALPRLATGVGGLDWKVVRPLIQSQLGDVDASIYVYSRFVPGKKAAEPKA
jgi:O-acetyl-ADP-ribose deacetylase (regulator of RNase III)